MAKLLPFVTECGIGFSLTAMRVTVRILMFVSPCVIVSYICLYLPIFDVTFYPGLFINLCHDFTRTVSVFPSQSSGELTH
jgi:hypothetical protein